MSSPRGKSSSWTTLIARLKLLSQCFFALLVFASSLLNNDKVTSDSFSLLPGRICHTSTCSGWITNTVLGKSVIICIVCYHVCVCVIYFFLIKIMFNFP